MTETTAEVISICPLTDSIIELVLYPKQYIPYQAGQYLQIKLEDIALSYSIANAPLGSHQYELHIRHDKSNPLHETLFREIREKGKLCIELPLGHNHIQALAKSLPILFIAGGTGFAPIKAMIEQLLASSDQRHFELFWGARSQSDLYKDLLVKQWLKHVAHFDYFSLLPGTQETLVGRVIEQHPKDLLSYQIVIAGPFDMALAAKEALLAEGVLLKRLYSDAF